MVKQHTEQVQGKPKRFQTRGTEQPPLVFGPQRLHYLYSVALPQINLTLVSVLQGIVFGVLLLSMPLPNIISWSAAFSFLLQQYFYLPFIISSLVIIFIWIQFVEASMFLFWPLSTIQAGLVFLLTLCEVVAFRAIASLPIWLAGLGCIAIVGGYITRRNLRLNTKEIYETSAPLQQSFLSFFESNRRTGKFYLVVGAITILIGFAYDWLESAIDSIAHQLGAFFPWVIFILLSVFLARMLWIDLVYRRLWLEHATEDTDLIILPHGVLTYSYEEEINEQPPLESPALTPAPSSISTAKKQRLPYAFLLSIGVGVLLGWSIRRYSTRSINKM